MPMAGFRQLTEPANSNRVPSFPTLQTADDLGPLAGNLIQCATTTSATSETKAATK
jgi:hypothetical protein